MSEPSSLGVNENEWQLVLHSKQAFDAASKESINDERMARAANGEIVSDSEW